MLNLKIMRKYIPGASLSLSAIILEKFSIIGQSETEAGLILICRWLNEDSLSSDIFRLEQKKIIDNKIAVLSKRIAIKKSYSSLVT